ncbi:hypothetical protein [Foetidibacter luteolus]|uniref:hypothetical protein n=1 Tax=Foetidibacter luteolus TaxID=2608880 RepID=UPI00129AD43F|nr:hypothetical protein [Foetidibacter luteolus]
MRHFKKISFIAFVLLVVWMVMDIYYPLQRNLRVINAPETARLDAAMWRSYYEKKKTKLFFQSAELLRTEFHFPYWRSLKTAYYAARAAFIFKDGKSRADYDKALPCLTSYFEEISSISNTAFDAPTAARQELEWWIIRRYRQQHPPAEWEAYLAATASAMYHLPAEKFKDYARLRVQAMLLRDDKEKNITEADWLEIERLLNLAWQSFGDQLS